MATERLDTVQDIQRAYGLTGDEDAGFGLADAGDDVGGSATAEGEEREASPLPLPADALTLSRAYEVKNVNFDRVTLKAPRGVDYWALGEPQEVQPNGLGGAVLLERLEVIRSYSLRMIEPPPHLKAIDVLEALNLADARKVRRAVLGFFEGAEGASP